MNNLDTLIQHPEKFDFFKAIQILEETTHPIQFENDPSFHRPISDLTQIRKRTLFQQEKWIVRTSFLNFFGQAGILTSHDIEFVTTLQKQKNTALSDFLNIFHSRLIAILTDALKRQQLISPPIFQDKKQQPYKSYAGLQLTRTKTKAALTRCLSHYFQCPITLNERIDSWHTLHQNHLKSRLGKGAIIGKKIRRTQQRFNITIGPLVYPHYLKFLPHTDQYKALVSMAKALSPAHLDVNVLLQCEKKGRPVLTLSIKTQGYLGWNTWLLKTCIAKSSLLNTQTS